jgi:TolA-binding protein
MNRVLVLSCAAVLAAPVAFSGKSLAQSSGPVSTETIEGWNAQLRDQVRRLEAERENIELHQRQRRLQAEKENAELHERVRQLQSDLSTMQSANAPPNPEPQRPAPAASSQPERWPPLSNSASTPPPQRAAAVPPPRPERAATATAEPEHAGPASRPRPQRAAPAERKPSRAQEVATPREPPDQPATARDRELAAFPEFATFRSGPAPAPASAPAPAATSAPASASFPAWSDSSVVVHGTIDLNSRPEGATAQVSLGGGCETPCAMEVSSDKPFSVTFTQRGYAPSTVNVQIQRGQPGVANPKFAPNPVFVQLTPNRTH